MTYMAVIVVSTDAFSRLLYNAHFIRAATHTHSLIIITSKFEKILMPSDLPTYLRFHFHENPTVRSSI